MKYINDTVRRQDRLMDEERAEEILKTAEYGINACHKVIIAFYGDFSSMQALYEEKSRLYTA